MGSRSLQLGGSAVHQASVEPGRQGRASSPPTLLEANPDDVVLDKVDGRFHVAGTPADRPHLGRAVATRPRATASPLSVITDFQAASATFPFGAHVAVVDVDTETGRVELVRHVAVDDAGRILNPLLADGQRHGGIAQGAAQALLEEVRYDDDGNPITSNLADYAAISATELPSFELVAMETPTDVNPLGREGHRRERHHRFDAGGAVRGRRRAGAPRRAPRRHAGEPERVWRAIQWRCRQPRR